MAYRLKGTYYAPCSCYVACPYNWGEPEGNDGYCSAAAVISVREGEIDGTDVSRLNVGLAADWPKGFVSGDGTGRLYFDPTTSQEQRAALERVLTGQAGGDAEGLGGVIPNWLPAQEAPIALDTSDSTTRFRIGDFGTAVIEPLRNSAGEITKVIAMPTEWGPETIMARGDGSRWSDPELKQWESRGHAESADIDWSG